jgi:putative ABC transport system permease protein
MADAFQLAWRQLRHEPRKLLAGIAGVVFSVVLMFMQVGFRDALFVSASGIQLHLAGDLFIIHQQSDNVALVFMSRFSRRRVQQALAVPEVQSATELYVDVAQWKNPWTARTRGILVLGIDPAVGALELPGVREHLDTIRRKDAVLFDARSRREYGPVAATFRAGGPVTVEINSRRTQVEGLFQLGASFATDGNLITSDLNFLRLFPNHTPFQVTAGILRLKPGADLRRAQAAVAHLMPPDVKVMTRDEFVKQEHDYWDKATPIGFIFNTAMIIAFLVGIVVVHQILYAEISTHLAQYATLKAMGYTHRFMLGIVAGASLILGLLGFLPGWVLSLGLYHLTMRATGLPMMLGAAKTAVVLLLTMTMCLVSGALAMQRLRAANPADMF